MRKHLLTISLLLALQPAWAQESYYNRGLEKGWYWYEIEPIQEPEPEPEEPPKPPELIVLQAPPKPEETPEPTPEEGPPPGSSAWLKANLENYLFAAMDNPTLENITAYLYLHRLMMDKASGFADNAKVALATEPLLSNDVRRPRFEAASEIMSSHAAEEAKVLLRQIAQGGQYVMVLNSRCDTCGPFLTSANTLAVRSGAKLDIVTTDGGAPASIGDRMGDVRVDPKLTAELKPVALPSLYLRRPDGKTALITASVLPANELLRNTIDVAYGKGWITDAAYQRTKPRNDVRIAMDANQPIPDEALNDPVKLVEFLRNKMTVGALR